MSPFIAVLIIVASVLEASAMLSDNEVITLWNILHNRFTGIGEMILPLTTDHVQTVVEGYAVEWKELNCDADEIIDLTDEVFLLVPRFNCAKSLSLEDTFSDCVNSLQGDVFEGVTHVGISRVVFDPQNRERLSDNTVLQKDMLVQFLIMLVKAPTNERGVLKQEELDEKSLNCIRERVLSLHNEKRALHGSKNLKLNEELNGMAQYYASALSNGEELVISPSGKNRAHGENIANYGVLSRHNMDAEDADFACEDWYNKKVFYNYQNPVVADLGKWETFTTMVWNGSDRMGLGVSYNTIRTKSGLKVHVIWVVAKYLETPNDPVKFLENVFPPKGSS